MHCTGVLGTLKIRQITVYNYFQQKLGTFNDDRKLLIKIIHLNF